MGWVMPDELDYGQYGEDGDNTGWVWRDGAWHYDGIPKDDHPGRCALIVGAALIVLWRVVRGIASARIVRR